MSTHPLNVYLVGKTGTGKSATANSLLGCKAFVSKPSTTSVTKRVSVHSSEVGGRKITVVDGPGVADTQIHRKEAIKQSIHHMDEVVAACPEGYHALLLMFRYGTRYTAEDRKSLATLKVLLGEDFVRKHAILVVTCGDFLVQELGTKTDGEKSEFSSFSLWLSEQTGDIAVLLEELQGRAVLFNNITEDLHTLTSQRDELFKTVDFVCKSGRRYTMKDYMYYSMSRQKALVEITFERVLEETKEKLEKISAQMVSIMSQPQKSTAEISSKLSLLEELCSQARTVRQEVETQDKRTGALKVVKKMVDAQTTSLTFAAQGMKMMLKHREQQDETEEEMRCAQEELRKQHEEVKSMQQEEDKKAAEKNEQRLLAMAMREIATKPMKSPLQRQLEQVQKENQRLEELEEEQMIQIRAGIYRRRQEETCSIQ